MATPSFSNHPSVPELGKVAGASMIAEKWKHATYTRKFTDAKEQLKIVPANFSEQIRVSSITGGAGSISP